jgi:hypothetical protein
VEAYDKPLILRYFTAVSVDTASPAGRIPDEQKAYIALPKTS